MIFFLHWNKIVPQVLNIIEKGKKMKKILLALLIASVVVCNASLQAMTSKEYKKWWEGYRTNGAIPYELKNMEDYYISSGLFNQSSNYWNDLNQYNIQQISEYGYENFKQTVSRNYFTWVVDINHNYAKNLKTVPLVEKLAPAERNKNHSYFSKEESAKYNEVTEYFINYFIKIGADSILAKVEEPLSGNPPFVKFRGKRVSQDLLNSLLDYQAVTSACPAKQIKTVVEIGAGYGRTAYCFLNLLPKVKYIIVDFPPALYLSQKYLSEVLPNKKVMTFRPFTSFDDISGEYMQADIVFLTPDQLKYLPGQSVDLFLAIDCLYEMKGESVAQYFKEANRLSEYMYFKCYQKTVLPLDEISYNMDSYPVHRGWKQIFKETCVVPSDFFHALYKMNP